MNLILSKESELKYKAKPIGWILPKGMDKAFKLHGIHTVEDVLKYTQKELLALDYIGEQSIWYLTSSLEANGIILL